MTHNLTFDTIYRQWPALFPGHTINLQAVAFCDPWAIATVCLKAIEFAEASDKRILLPEELAELTYLKRMHLAEFLDSLSYHPFLSRFEAVAVNERDNVNIQEVLFCRSFPEFEARLSSRIRAMFRGYGLGETEEQFATGLVAELGNNVFDHNLGSWPTAYQGAIIAGQHYPQLGEIHVVVADPGVGFWGSLKRARPGLADDREAIKLGLSGVTGRVGEKRGNGLKLIQAWTIERFHGTLRIQSGRGLVEVDQAGIRESTVTPVAGTIAGLVIRHGRT